MKKRITISRNKILFLCIINLFVFILVFMVACNYDNNNFGNINDDNSTKIEKINESEMFTDRDKSGDFDMASANTITLADNASLSNSNNVSIDENEVTISQEGIYVLSGSLTNGKIIVNCADTDKVQLVFDNVNINCDTSAAIYVLQADKVFVTLAENSITTLSNQSDFVAIDDNNIDSVVFSKDDLTFNGSGTLNINANYGHGIVCKDDLVITNGVYNIESEKSGLKANDSVRIADGTFTINAGADGIHSENSDDATLGYIYILNGNFEINCSSDGIDANCFAQMLGGTYEINVTGKGIKVCDELLIANGTYIINSTDDSIHSNLNICICDGSFTLETTDDGIHADSNLTIENGNLTILNSYEGLESESIDIKGGNIALTASDDGINAAGGNDGSGFGGGFGGEDMFASDSNCYIKITGGILNIDASGDGIDSNGNIYMTGGECYVSGPTNNGNGALDYNGSAQITGGKAVIVGSSGMAQNFGTTSTQCSIMVNFNSYVTSEIIIKDSNNNELISFSPNKKYNSVVVSLPSFYVGESYTIVAGSQSQTITLTSKIYGSSSSMGGGGGFRR